MSKPAAIPNGAWPRRMAVDLAAGYCGERTIEDFLKRVGAEYPLPRVSEGRRRLWLRDDLDAAILPSGTGVGSRHRRGFVTVKLPRHVLPKILASDCLLLHGSYKVPEDGLPVPNEPLGTDYARHVARVAGPKPSTGCLMNGTMPAKVSRLQRGGAAHRQHRLALPEYRQSRAYLEKVNPRSRRNYEWNMREICDTLTNRSDRVGSRPIKSVTPLGADKLYDRFVKGGKGNRLRTAEKLIVLCRKAWRVVHRLYPGEFPKDIPNPWLGVTMATRVKLVKPAVTREQVYAFANGCWSTVRSNVRLARLSASSGCSGRKTSLPVISNGLGIA